MTTVGDAIYAQLEAQGSLVRVRGYLVDLEGKLAVIAISPKALALEDGAEVVGPNGEVTNLLFVKTPWNALRGGRPQGWKDIVALDPWPPLPLVMRLYNSTAVDAPEVTSSDEMLSASSLTAVKTAMAPSSATAPTASASTTALPAILQGMQEFLKGPMGAVDEESEDGSSDEDGEPLPPGVFAAGSSKTTQKEKEKDETGPQVQKAAVMDALLKQAVGKASSVLGFEKVDNFEKIHV